MFKFITFLYDTLRFSILIFLLLPEIRPTIDNDYFTLGIFCVAQLTLFPLMTFFLWLDSQKYKVFAYLYTAGKITGICAVIAGVFSLRGNFVPALLLDDKKLFAALAVPCFTFLDILFMIPVILSMKNAQETKP